MNALGEEPDRTYNLYTECSNKGACQSMNNSVLKKENVEYKYKRIELRR